MIEIFHISDLHIGKILGGSCAKKTEELIDKLEKRFKILAEKNRYLLITGDITDRGTKGFFEKALSILEPYRKKIFFIPGNHDYSDGLPSGFFYDDRSARRFDEEFAEQLDPNQVFYNRRAFFQPLEDGTGTKICLIGLNSCLKLVGTPSAGSTFGLIGYGQLTSLTTWLNDKNLKDIPKLVYLHHIPYKPAKGILMSLIDWEELMDIAKGKVDILAYGHEGKMRELKAAKVGATGQSSRAMRARRGKKWGIKYLLDANHSLKEGACYHIRIMGKNIEANKVPL